MIHGPLGLCLFEMMRKSSMKVAKLRSGLAVLKVRNMRLQTQSQYERFIE